MDSDVLIYFREIGNHRPEFIKTYRTVTGVGTFWVSSLPFVRNCLAACVSQGLLAPGQEWIDAGAGDFRVCLVAAEMGLSSLGVEADEDLVKLGRLNIASLGLNNPPRVMQSDFRDSEMMSGFRGGKISVYNFANHPESAARLVSSHGAPGSTFMLYDGTRPCLSLPGLEKIRTFSFHEMVSEVERESSMGTDPEDVAYADDRIHVYIKQ
jgi:hypothetical protein